MGGTEEWWKRWRSRKDIPASSAKKPGAVAAPTRSGYENVSRDQPQGNPGRRKDTRSRNKAPELNRSSKAISQKKSPYGKAVVQRGYRYQPLPESNKYIRLLEFTGQSDLAEIKCSLSTFKLKSAPRYAAVSYTWGSETTLKTIWINGEPFPVREKCHLALSQVREHLSDVYSLGLDHVWIMFGSTPFASIKKTSMRRQPKFK